MPVADLAITEFQDFAAHHSRRDARDLGAFRRSLRLLHEDFGRVNDEDSALLVAASAMRTLEDLMALVERAATGSPRKPAA